jgi:hypothetical protein
MPKIRRQNLPPKLLGHLLDRIRFREISADLLAWFADWLDAEPKVPKDMTVAAGTSLFAFAVRQ